MDNKDERPHMGAIEVKSGDAYQASFGSVPNGVCYSDPYNMKSLRIQEGDTPTVDLRGYLSDAMSIGLKALTSQTGGAGTAGYALVPVYLDPRVVDTTRKETPLVEIIPRVTNYGLTADYDQITAKGGAYMANEDPAMTEHDDSYTRQSTAIRYTYSYGRVTGQAQAAIPSLILSGMQPGGGAVGTFTDQSAMNAKQMEVLVKTRSVREMEEDVIFNGNNTTSGNSNNPDGVEYDGIIALMGATNTVDKNTSALELDDIETAAQYAFVDGGRPSIGAGSPSAIKDARKLLLDAYRFAPTDVAAGTLPFGIPTGITAHTMLGPQVLIPSRFMSEVSGSIAMYFLDMTVTEMRVMQDLSYKDLAPVGDSEPFLLKVYESLIIKNTAFCSSITEIA